MVESFPKSPLANDLSKVAILPVLINERVRRPFVEFGVSKTSIDYCQPVCEVIKQIVKSRLVPPSTTFGLSAVLIFCVTSVETEAQ